MSWSDFVKIPWNKYEAVLLIDAYERFRKGIISRPEAVIQVSRRLRYRMQKLHIPISDAYRNETGISLQMSAIEYVFSDGTSGISHISNLFKECVELYLSDTEIFNDTLRIAETKYPMPPEEVSSDLFPALYTENAQVTRFLEEEEPKYISRKLYDILKNKFPRGYRLNSFMETSRLKKFYSEEYDQELNMEPEDIDEDVKACGIEYEGRVYLPELMLGAVLKNELIQYIHRFFDNGGECLYYEILYQHFQEQFLDSRILTSKMLRQYLEYINTDNWIFKEQFFSIDKNAEVDIKSVVEDYVKSQGGVVSKDEAVKGLSMYPEDMIREAFEEKSTTLIHCGRNQRFHIDNFVISTAELSIIDRIIKKAISEYRYIVFCELVKDINANVPAVINNNAVFSELGLRNALAVLLGNKYNFSNSVISDYNAPIKAADAFVELSKRPQYTIDDVNELAESFGSIANVYLEQMLNYSVRVDINNFVAYDQVHFDVDEIDAVLSRLCDKNYIALSDITTLSALPACEYSWTPFLLECYVAFHSKVFKLVHANYFAQKYTTGGMVRINSGINDFRTLAAMAIADSDIQINKKEALNFLSEKKYIVQRRYEDIDAIISLAMKLRQTK